MLVCDIAFQCIVVKCARGVLAEYVSIHSVAIRPKRESLVCDEELFKYSRFAYSTSDLVAS